MNRNDELSETRDRDVYALYKELTATGGYSTDIQVICTIEALPAPRHYVDAQTAVRRMRVIRNGGTLTQAGSGRYYALYREWLRLPRKERKPMVDACERLLDRPAPSFYLSPRQIRRAIARERRKEKEALYEKIR